VGGLAGKFGSCLTALRKSSSATLASSTSKGSYSVSATAPVIRFPNVRFSFFFFWEITYQGIYVVVWYWWRTSHGKGDIAVKRVTSPEQTFIKLRINSRAWSTGFSVESQWDTELDSKTCHGPIDLLADLKVLDWKSRGHLRASIYPNFIVLTKDLDVEEPSNSILTPMQDTEPISCQCNVGSSLGEPLQPHNVHLTCNYHSCQTSLVSISEGNRKRSLNYSNLPIEAHNHQ